MILYKNPTSSTTRATISTYSDSAFNVTKGRKYGQTCFVTGIKYETDNEPSDVYHAIYWISSKEIRASFYSYGTEILACAHAEDLGFNLKQELYSLLSV